MDQMKRIALALLASAVGTTALLSGSAAASGPAPPAKDIRPRRGRPPLHGRLGVNVS
jgi:hypothetical protein